MILVRLLFERNRWYRERLCCCKTFQFLFCVVFLYSEIREENILRIFAFCCYFVWYSCISFFSSPFLYVFPTPKCTAFSKQKYFIAEIKKKLASKPIRWCWGTSKETYKFILYALMLISELRAFDSVVSWTERNSNSFFLPLFLSFSFSLSRHIQFRFQSRTKMPLVWTFKHIFSRYFPSHKKFSFYYHFILLSLGFKK